MTNADIRQVPASAADVLDAGSCALLLWDLQNGLGGQAPRLPELMPVWQRLRQAAAKSGALIVRSRHVPPRLDVMDPVERWRISRRKHGENRPEYYLLPGSRDSAYIPGFEPGPDELVIDKAAPSLFHGTPADARLRARGIRTLVLAGVATDIGIDFTARHAMALGYFPVIAEDAVAGFTDSAHEHAMAVLRSVAFIASSDKIIARWSATADKASAWALTADNGKLYSIHLYPRNTTVADETRPVRGPGDGNEAVAGAVLTGQMVQ